jgi:hypothetical protein
VDLLILDGKLAWSQEKIAREFLAIRRARKILDNGKEAIASPTGIG